MYVEPWMLVVSVIFVGVTAVYNRRAGFKHGLKDGITIGFDGALAMLQLNKLITVDKDGKILPYEEKNA